LELEIDPVEPVLLTFSERPIGSPSIVGPHNAHLGDTAEFQIRSDSPAERRVVHLEVIDPDGNMVAAYSGNSIAADSGAAKVLPLALNDKSGVWKLRASDILSGETATAELTVEP
jgi:hypothetical protein